MRPRSWPAFHARVGFEIEEGDGDVDGMSVHTNSDGDEKGKVVFAKALF